MIPSLKQIKTGLILEARLQVKLAMGNVKEQKCVFEAQANIEETWNELIALANVIDQDAPLDIGVKDGKPTCHGLCDSTLPVVGLLTYIW